MTYTDPMLVALNIFIASMLFLLPFYLITKKLKLGVINPFTIVLAFQAPIFIAKNFMGPMFNFGQGLSDYWYNFSLAVQNIYTLGYVVIFYISILAFNSINIKNLNATLFSGSIRITRSDSRRMAVLFITVSVLFLAYLAYQTMGIFQWAADPRTGYQFHRVGKGHLYALSILFASLSFLLFIISEPKPKKLLLLGLAYCCYAYLYGSKMIILEFFIFLLVSLWFFDYRHLKSILLFGGFGAFALMLLNYGSFESAAVFRYFDYHNNSAMYYKYLHETGDFFGGEILITGFWDFVPRAFYPDKPYAYGPGLIREIFWPGAAERTHTPGMAGPVGIYGDFGIAGVVAFALFQTKAILDAFVMVYVIRTFSVFRDTRHIEDRRQRHVFSIVCFAFLFAPAFMVYIPFPLNLIISISLLIFILLLKYIYKPYLVAK